MRASLLLLALVALALCLLPYGSATQASVTTGAQGDDDAQVTETQMPNGANGNGEEIDDNHFGGTSVVLFNSNRVQKNKVHRMEVGIARLLFLPRPCYLFVFIGTCLRGGKRESGGREQFGRIVALLLISKLVVVPMYSLPLPLSLSFSSTLPLSLLLAPQTHTISHSTTLPFEIVILTGKGEAEKGRPERHQGPFLKRLKRRRA